MDVVNADYALHQRWCVVADIPHTRSKFLLLIKRLILNGFIFFVIFLEKFHLYVVFNTLRKGVVFVS